MWKTFEIYGSILFAIESCTDSWYILRHNDGGVRSVIASWKNDVYRCVETTAVVLPEIDLEYEDDSWMHPRGNRLLGEKRIISIRLLMKKIPSLLNATLCNAAALRGKIERIQKRNSEKKYWLHSCLGDYSGRNIYWKCRWLIDVFQRRFNSHNYA